MYIFEIVMIISLLLLAVGTVIGVIWIFKPNLLPGWCTIIPLLGLLLLFLSIFLYYEDNDIKFSYIDQNGNEGVAEYCEASGGMYCRRADGTRIAVKSYKWVNE